MEIYATSSEFGIISHDAIEDLLTPLGHKLIRNSQRGPMSEEELLQLDPKYEAIASYSSQDAFTERAIDHFPKLKVISRHGIGFDQVDIRAAALKKIYVTNTHEGAYEERAVSDMAIAQLLILARNLFGINETTKAGRWERPITRDLYGRTLGIIGLGRIGKMTALKAKAFGLKLLAYDVFHDETFAKENGVKYVELEELLREADFITLHCPFTGENRGLIGAREMGLMKNGAILINCARGVLVDEAALYNAAKSRKLGGVGVDVFEKEPPVGNPLLSLPNVITTSHVAAYTQDTIMAMDLIVVQACVDVLANKKPANIVNGL